MRAARTFRKMFLLVAVLLTASVTATACSVIPDLGGLSGNSGSSQESTQAQAPRGEGQQELDPGEVVPDVSGMLGNAEACVSVSAVVITGSTRAFIARLDPSGEGTKSMANQVTESMKKVPAEIKGDLENLLSVINDSAINGNTFNDKKLEQAMKPSSMWVEKNCTNP